MGINYEQLSWKRDIAQFERWKNYLSTLKTPRARELIINVMKRIQSKYPKYINANEIPQE